jgi:hypothetical protein
MNCKIPTIFWGNRFEHLCHTLGNKKFLPIQKHPNGLEDGRSSRHSPTAAVEDDEGWVAPAREASLKAWWAEGELGNGPGRSPALRGQIRGRRASSGPPCQGRRRRGRCGRAQANRRFRPSERHPRWPPTHRCRQDGSPRPRQARDRGCEREIGAGQDAAGQSQPRSHERRHVCGSAPFRSHNRRQYGRRKHLCQPPKTGTILIAAEGCGDAEDARDNQSNKK